MPKIDASTIEKYQALLQKDPNSQVFAPLAEAYREMGMLNEALKVATAGVQRHPQFAGGLVSYARVLRDSQQGEKALSTLQRAVTLAPENILAYRLLAEIHLDLKHPKEALKAFKMVLFLDPQSKTARQAVQKLESLTADEYDDEIFAMQKLPNVNLAEAAPEPQKLEPITEDLRPSFLPQRPSRPMERMLSLIDAFIVRNDLEKAHALLKDTKLEFGAHPEIDRRLKALQITHVDEIEPDALPLKPLAPRETRIREKKLDTLEMLLRRIEQHSAQG